MDYKDVLKLAGKLTMLEKAGDVLETAGLINLRIQSGTGTSEIILDGADPEQLHTQEFLKDMQTAFLKYSKALDRQLKSCVSR